MYKVVVVFIRKLQYSVRSPPENDEVIRFNLNVQPCQKRSPKATSFPCVMCFSTPRAPLHPIPRILTFSLNGFATLFHRAQTKFFFSSAPLFHRVSRLRWGANVHVCMLYSSRLRGQNKHSFVTRS